MLVSYMYFLMLLPTFDSFFFFFNDTATTEIYTLSLHDALPIYFELRTLMNVAIIVAAGRGSRMGGGRAKQFREISGIDRKSTRLNSSHLVISYAVFCLKKKKKDEVIEHRSENQDA